MSDTALVAQQAYQSKCAPRFVDYFNPGDLKCHRQVACGYYGEHYHQPDECCEAPRCMPGPPDNLQSAIDCHVKKLTWSRNVNPISLPCDDRNLNKYDSDMMKIALKLLRDWREDIWLM